MTVLGFAHESLISRRRIRRLCELLSRLIPEDCRLLDVGCGDGQLAHALLQTRPDLRIDGVDTLVRKRTSVPVMAFDGVTLPYKESSFDGVMLVDVLHHTSDPLSLLREALRVSRRWLVVKDHIRQGPGAALRLQLMDYIGNARHGIALPYNYLSLTQWSDLRAALNVRLITEVRKLDLYAKPIDYVFGSGLHFLALWERVVARIEK
jgi:SAM-dependent methyltransferase